MKKVKLLIVLVLANLLTFAQTSIIDNIDSVLLAKYIKAAIANYPLKRAADATLAKAKAQKSIATLGIFDMFNGGYFYSPSKSDALVVIPGGGSNGTSNIVTRGFQFGVNLNLGGLLSRPAQLKSAKAEYIIAQEQYKDYNNMLVNSVKARYYAFLSARRMLELRTLASADLAVLFENMTKQFKNNEISIEVYTATKNSFVESQAANLSAEVDYLKTKNDLEDIIGSPLEKIR